jgi:hypothetical protein
VKKHHIEGAIRRNSHACMIADAIQEAIPGIIHLTVTTNMGVRFSDPKTGRRYFYHIPLSAVNALKKWDKGEEISPFRVNLITGHSEIMRRRQHGFKASKKQYKATGAKPSTPRLRDAYGVNSHVI